MANRSNSLNKGDSNIRRYARLDRARYPYNDAKSEHKVWRTFVKILNALKTSSDSLHIEAFYLAGVPWPAG
jgi:hypothetical protein